MDAVTVSSKYQVVIPKSVRDKTNIRPGERLQVICFDGRIEMIRIQPIQQMRGFLNGYDASFVRDEDDRA